MSNSAGDHLSPLDALFVYLEKKEMPMHIGSVGVFDGPIAMDRLKALVEAKLPLIPRYRQRLVFPPLHIGLPTWEWDPDFQIDRHFSHARLKHGTDHELETLAGEHFAKIMDRNRPLWDVLLVDGLKGHRSAIMIRVHHCLVDGIAGVALMNILFDQTRNPPKLPKAPPFDAPPLPDTGKRFVDALVNAYEEFTTRILSAQSEALNVAQAMLGQPPIDSLDQFPGAVPFTAVERLPFNKPVLGPRQFAWAELPLPEVKALKDALGGTLNDVVLTIVTLAVRRYCEFHGHSMQDRVLRLMAPVNLRRDVINPGMGNSISFLPINIPLDIADPARLLHEVHRITESLKRGHVADVITLTAKWLGTAPAPFQVAFGMLGNNLPLPPWNMVCTNVPGPQFPLYMLGRELLTAYPYVPIGNEMGMNCAVESYNGKLFVNFAGDAVAIPDISRVRDLLVDSFHLLRARATAATAEASEPAPEAEEKPKKPVRPKTAAKKAAKQVDAGSKTKPVRTRVAKKAVVAESNNGKAVPEVVEAAVAEPVVEAAATVEVVEETGSETAQAVSTGS
ncbi:MAG: wax ester/triacylglycerol synthase family O-acyltransferase [Acidobacteria bacterium]|nr:wax ester/triacylglycerol synthase family O-acyltransferase [Acidobacteriota bacterium]